MEVVCKGKSYHLSSLVIKGMQIDLNGFRRVTKCTYMIIGDKKIDLFELAHNFYHLGKRMKINNDLIVIEEGNYSFLVEFSLKGEKLNWSKIRISAYYLYFYNQSDLSSFYAHELGHLQDYKWIQQIYNQRRAMKSVIIFLLFFLLVLGFYVNESGFWFLTALWSSILGFIYPVVHYSYAKKLEYKADYLGAKLVGHEQMIDSLYSLLANKHDDEFSLFSTHPSFKQRIRNIKKSFFFQRLFK